MDDRFKTSRLTDRQAYALTDQILGHLMVAGMTPDPVRFGHTIANLVEVFASETQAAEGMKGER